MTEPNIEVVGTECTELHCSGVSETHDYGSPICDFVLKWEGAAEILYTKSELKCKECSNGEHDWHQFGSVITCRLCGATYVATEDSHIPQRMEGT